MNRKVLSAALVFCLPHFNRGDLGLLLGKTAQGIANYISRGVPGNGQNGLELKTRISHIVVFLVEQGIPCEAAVYEECLCFKTMTETASDLSKKYPNVELEFFGKIDVPDKEAIRTMFHYHKASLERMRLKEGR